MCWNDPEEGGDGGHRVAALKVEPARPDGIQVPEKHRSVNCKIAASVLTSPWNFCFAQIRVTVRMTVAAAIQNRVLIFCGERR